MTPPPERIADLNRVHFELDEFFFRHQAALLEGDYGKAKECLKVFEEALHTHIKEEEDILLPLYKERVEPPPRGGDPEIFTGEHQKINEWLHRLKLRLHRLVPSVPDLKAVLALLDDEAHFKKFMEHHILREDHLFYPQVEKVLAEKEKAGLLRLMTFSFEEAPFQERNRTTP